MNWKIVLAIITCNVVMMSASYTMLIPFLPLYLENELGATDDNVNMWAGVCFAISFAVTAFMAPIWGKLSDVQGRKLMIIRSGVLIALSYFLASQVTTPLQLVLVRALQGFAAGLWPASLALMSAYAPKNRVGLCMGVMQSANITGGIIGPLLGGILSQSFGMRNCFILGAIALGIIVLITIFFIKEPPKDAATLERIAKIKENKKKGIKQPSVYLALISREAVRVLLFTTCIANMVILLIQPMMTLYIKQLIGNTENLLLISGIIFSLVGIGGAIAAPFWGTNGQKYGFIITLRLALFIAGVLIASQCIPDTLIPFAIIQFIIGLGFSGIFPSANSILITQTCQQERGAAFGLLFSAQMIGGAIGPLLTGFLASIMPLKYIFLLAGSLLIIGSIHLTFFLPASLRNKNSNINCNEANHKVNDDYIRKIKKELEDNEIKKESVTKS